MANAPRFHTGEGMPSPELSQPPFRVVEEYAEVIMTDDGKTLRDLMGKCEADLSIVPAEMIDDYALKAMNERGVPIKAEHAQHVQGRLEARGVEMKMPILPEKPLEPTNKIIEPVESFVKLSDVHNAVIVDVDNNMVVAARRHQEQMALQEAMSLPAPVETSAYTADEPYHETTSVPDEAVVAQMDAWLEQIEPQVQQQNAVTEASVMLPPELNKVEDSSNAHFVNKTVSRAELMSVPAIPRAIDQAESVRPILTATESSLTNETHHDNTVPEAMEAAATPEASAAAISLDKASTEVYEPTAAPIELSELLPDKANMAETDIGQTEPAPLLTQLGEHIKTDPDLSREAAEAATELVSRIDELAERLIVAYAEADLSPTDLQAIEKDLVEACQELLTTLGIDYDDETIKRITSTVLKQKLEAMSAAETQTALPQDEGTHEHKFFALQDFVFDMPDAIPAFHLLGRYVLWQHNQSSAAA